MTDTNIDEGAGAAKGKAEAFPASPSGPLEGVGAVAGAGGFGTGGFGIGGFGGALNTEALNDLIVLRTAEPTESLPVPPEPSASTTPSTVPLSGRLTATASMRASPTTTVSPASAEPNPAERTIILERTLSERPEDFREGARALSKAIADQIDLLNASKPNDPDALIRHDEFVGFLQQIAERLDSLADALDAAINAASSERAPFLEGAANIARSIGDFVREGLEKHRSAIQVCAVQVPAVWLGVLGLHWLGVDPTTAFCGVAELMGWKTISKDREKK